MILAISIQGLQKLENQHCKSTLYVPERASATKLCNVFSTYFGFLIFFVYLKHPELH